MPNEDKQAASRLLTAAGKHTCYDDPDLVRHVVAWFDKDVPAVVLRMKKLSIGEMVEIYVGYLSGDFSRVKNESVRRCLVDHVNQE